jgi:hypothetical protein
VTVPYRLLLLARLQVVAETGIWSIVARVLDVGGALKTITQKIFDELSHTFA